MSRRLRQNNEKPDVSEDWVKPIVKENLSERAYMDLKTALMYGKLRPGERLRLRPMSARFGISATPMREALLRLVSEKTLTLDPRGTVVVPTLTLDELVEIRSIRVDLEGKSAAAAALNSTEEEIDALEVIHTEITECHRNEDFERAIVLNTEFHLDLCRSGRMPVTYDIVEGLWMRCGPILSHLYDGGLPDWEPHPHKKIIKALRARDASAAHEAMKEDIVRGGQGLLAYVRASAPT